MNKKIFTLLAGILMLGLFAIPSNAQSGRNSFIRRQDLRVGGPVRNLQVGSNPSFYYLAVDSVIGKYGTNPPTPPHAQAGILAHNALNDTANIGFNRGGSSKNALVLFMAKDTVGRNSGKYHLFIDTINVVKRIPGTRDYKMKDQWAKMFSDKHPNTEISASALWCINVTNYDQGQNPTFDFTNKQHEALLEVDVFDRDSWGLDSSRYFANATSDWRTSSTSTLVPGGLSGWEFSETYATKLNRNRPLISYLDDTHDTVAVLCLARTRSSTTGARDTLRLDSAVCVKIASARDVQERKVDGMLLFTLHEAMPFALDASDINSHFASTTVNNLKFDPAVSGNPFALSTLKAEHLDLNDSCATIVERAFLRTSSTASWTNPMLSHPDTVIIRDTVLDHMGYLHLRNGATGPYLFVDTFYHAGNAGGDQFLRFGWSTRRDMFRSLPTWTNPSTPAYKRDSMERHIDSLMYGQYVWRLVYYPSGDSIYINPFKASYKPTYDPVLWNNGDTSVMATGWKTQQYFTYAAFPDSAIMVTHLGPTGLAVDTATVGDNILQLDSNYVKTLRLRDGFMGTHSRAANAPLPYKYNHRLYVSLQNLNSGRVVTLHSNHTGMLPAGDRRVNVHINYGNYNPCTAVGSDRVSIPADLYLIRNTDGQYLHVPLYSAHDSAVWTYLDEFVHPEELPSFQWVVEKRYRGSETTSPINIINREFGHRVGSKYGLAFENVQLKKDMEHFSFRTDRWRWNEEKKVNERTTTFDAAKSNMSEKNGATFIALPKKYKNDPLLGYQWINPDTSIVNLYAFNYASGIDNNRYISTATNFDMNAYPRTDTCLYIGAKDNFDVAYFRMDTIGAENGKLNEYGYKADNSQVADLVTLKRQAYRLNYENPFKYCLGTLSVSNAAQHYYSLSSRLTAPLTHILGRPVFYLRDVYMENDGVKEFALVQVMDTVAMQSADSTQLKTYMTQTLGSQITELMMKNLRIAGKFNPGLFVLAVDEPTLKLKFDYRGNSVTRVSTFRLKKDADPIYRRFNTELEGKIGDDSPRTMKFFRTSSMTTGKDYLFENTGALKDQLAYYKGPRNYLGLVSSNSNPNAKTSIFVDTAYVNRGTGYIKPQYLLMIRPSIVSDTLGCDDNGELTIHLPGYRRGMYLINATDSANMERTAGVDDERNTYLWNTQWERFVFTDAIHANDALYILGGADLSNLYTKVDYKGNVKTLDLAKLDAVSDPTPAAPKNGKIRKITLGNNYHKDCVFSFRLVERGSPQKDFLIESETAYRGEPDTSRKPMIAPCVGGWLKIQNGVPVISRSDEEKRIPEGDLFNVEMTSEDPVSNVVVPATTGVKVVAENGSVTVLNASGKRVVISNVLGQTVANTVLTSDRATVSAPKGVVLVAVEGEPVVKALVK